MSVVVDPAVFGELSTCSGDCALEVVGARDVDVVERGLRVAAELLRDVTHPQEPGEPFIHDAEVRRGAGGPVLWFDAGDAEAYPGVVEALVERVLAALTHAAVTGGVLRAVPGPAAEEPPPKVIAGALSDRAFLQEQLEGFPWPSDVMPLVTGGEGPATARRRYVRTSSGSGLAEVATFLIAGLSRQHRLRLIDVGHEITSTGDRREVVTFVTPHCRATAYVSVLGGRCQLRVVLDPPTTR